MLLFFSFILVSYPLQSSTDAVNRQDSVQTILHVIINHATGELCYMANCKQMPIQDQINELYNYVQISMLLCCMAEQWSSM